MSGRGWLNIALLTTAIAAGCCHPAPVDPTDKYLHEHPPGTSENPANNSVPNYEYYTGSDAQHDYFTILDGPGGRQHPFALDRDPKAWPNPMPKTTDPNQWRLVPGSAAP